MIILNESTIVKYPTIERTDIWKVTLYGDDKSPDYIFELSGVALEDSKPYKIVNFREKLTDILEAQRLVASFVFLLRLFGSRERVNEADYPLMKSKAIELWKHETLPPISLPKDFQITYMDLPEEFR